MELNRPILYDIACHFYVSHSTGATINAILQNIDSGNPLNTPEQS